MAQAEVVLMANSYVEGWYVSDEETVARRLQDRLGVPVANLGVAGYGTMQELIVLKRDAARLGAKTVVWIFFEGNDLYEDQEFENALLALPSAPTEASQRQGLTQAHGWWRRSFLRNGLSSLRALLHPVVPIQCRYCADVSIKARSGEVMCFFDYASLPWGEFEQSRWENTKRTLVEAKKFAHERDMRLLFVYAPIKFRVYREFGEFRPGDERREWGLWPLPELFLDFCRVQGLACLDLTEPFRTAVRNGGMPYPWNDTHWSVEGHDLVAAKLQEVLRSHGWAESRRTSPPTTSPAVRE